MKNYFLVLSLLTGVLLLGIVGQTAAVHAQAVATYGAGGALMPFYGEQSQPPQLRLLTQEIRIALPSRRVLVRSIFRNEGKNALIRLGFPETGGTGQSQRFPKSGYLRDLQFAIDGTRVPLTLHRPANLFYEGDKYDSEYSVFWMRRVEFKRGQTRAIEYSFQSGRGTMRLSDPSGGATQIFSFSLANSTVWKGPIGNLKIVFDVAGLKDFQEVEVDVPRGQKITRSRNKWIWQAKNFAARENEVIAASWWPGVKFFEVDGEEISSRAVVVNQNAVQGDYDSVYPVKRGGKIWVPLRLLLEWLPAAPEGEKNGITRAAIETYFSLQKGARSLYVIVGSRELEASENGETIGRFEMSESAYTEKTAVMVELAPAVRALGGRIQLQKGVVRIFWK